MAKEMMEGTELVVHEPKSLLKDSRQKGYIREFSRNGMTQWDCPDCGYVNIDQRSGELRFGESMRCKNCNTPYIRVAGERDNEHEIIAPEIADKILRF